MILGIDLEDLQFLISVALCLLASGIAIAATLQWKRSPTEQMLRRHFGGV